MVVVGESPAHIQKATSPAGQMFDGQFLEGKCNSNRYYVKFDFISQKKGSDELHTPFPFKAINHLGELY